jgi:hypothetical protein
VVQSAAILERILNGSGQDRVERAGKKEFGVVQWCEVNGVKMAGYVCTGKPVFVKRDIEYYLVDPGKAIVL